MARVLLGAGDALAAPEAVFSLLAAGHEARLVHYERRGTPAAAYLPVGGPITLPDPARSLGLAVAALRAALAQGTVDVLLPLDDLTLWLFDGAGGTLPSAGATGKQARFALDKRAQVQAAEAAGFALPATEVAETPVELEAALGKIACPAILRPALAVQERAGRLFKGATMYLMSRAEAAEMDLSTVAYPLLVQPLLPGTGEGIFGFAGPLGVTAWLGHERLRMMNPHGSGSSACRSRWPSAEERAAAERLVRAANWRGPFMVETLRDQADKILFVEFNGRIWGSTALARRASYEYPAWAVAQALDPNFTPNPPPLQKELEVRHLGRDVLHLAHVLRGPKSGFHRAGWPSLLTTVAAVFRPGPAKGFYNYDPSYPRFWLREALTTVRRGLFS